jgi:hypothetical protein
MGSIKHFDYQKLNEYNKKINSKILDFTKDYYVIQNYSSIVIKELGSKFTCPVYLERKRSKFTFQDKASKIYDFSNAIQFIEIGFILGCHIPVKFNFIYLIFKFRNMNVVMKISLENLKLENYLH